jgi:hypothetical protein
MENKILNFIKYNDCMITTLNDMIKNDEKRQETETLITFLRMKQEYIKEFNNYLKSYLLKSVHEKHLDILDEHFLVIESYKNNHDELFSSTVKMVKRMTKILNLLETMRQLNII